MRPSFGLTIVIGSLSLLSMNVSANPLKQRTLSTDLCVDLHAKLELPLLGSIGKLDVCICASTVPAFVEVDVVAKLASTLVGKDSVIAIIMKLIQDSNPSHCVYPDHAVPSCVSGNPCGFACDDGFVFQPPAQCVCNPPSVVCNGKCIYGACPSGTPKRESLSRRAPSKNFECPTGQTACGILGRSAKVWECIDTQSELESCGGCILPLYSGSNEPLGRDCTMISGVSDVSCIAGSCRIHRCMPGYTLSGDSSACTPYEPSVYGFQVEEVPGWNHN